MRNIISKISAKPAQLTIAITPPDSKCKNPRRNGVLLSPNRTKIERNPSEARPKWKIYPKKSRDRIGCLKTDANWGYVQDWWKIPEKISEFLENVFRDCSATVLRLFCDCSATVPRLFRDCSATVLRLFRDCSATVLRLFWQFCDNFANFATKRVRNTKLAFCQVKRGIS